MQDAGAFSIVFEMVPAATTRAAVNQLNIPIIGIGAGPDAAGRSWCGLIWQVCKTGKPSFAQVFGQVGAELKHAAQNYRDAVVNRTFPAPENYP
ncbi:3-methyl-2-oxobutanoate hydroxymethyltransferase [Mobiluncus curtisii]|uniref:3-methyl-2-oxobutanoate hydroxymethyltransferase n=1 Tax=Mobiluncus curtisii TaxID=2051 RepID=A0A2X3BDD0_9ACTO|nr:3-methyl-2-oxobutanoate hydroxymethyltransferase [Mobiluncus curtisii]SQC01642.1 3-methyl-2-oxobutanoate hydroxymethyltransferase [Mobiluncus curtisii]